MIRLFKRSPASPPTNGMSEIDRQKAFWLLKKYSSLTTWTRDKLNFDDIVAEIERLASAGHTLPQAWLTDFVYEEQAQYEKALNKLSRGDRSCFLWGPDGSFAYVGVTTPYLDRLLDPREYCIDEELYVPLRLLMGRDRHPVTDGKQARRQGSPARWMPISIFNEELYGPFNFPDPLPDVPLHKPLIRRKTGEEIPHFGIWEPDSPGTCMNYLRAGREAPRAPLPGATSVDTTWTLLWIDDRYTDGIVPAEEALYYPEPGARSDAAPDSANIARIESGKPCPRAGFWFTPASANSRRWFDQGAIMPSQRTDYGLTIWQWDPDQSAPPS